MLCEAFSYTCFRCLLLLFFFLLLLFFSIRSELIYAGPCTGDLGGTGVGVGWYREKLRIIVSYLCIAAVAA